MLATSKGEGSFAFDWIRLAAMGRSCGVTLDETSKDTNRGKSNFIQQLGLAVALSSAMLSNGLTVGYPAVALPAMQANTSGMIVNDNQASWIASLPQLSTLFGCLLVGPLMDRFGRKPGTLLATITSAAGWLVLGVTRRLWLVYLGRLLCGFGMGLASTGVSVLLAELAEPAYRTPLTMARNVSFSLGLTLVYSLGLAFKRDWLALGVVCSALPIVSTFLVLALVPESKVWRNSIVENKNSGHLNWVHFWRSRRRPEVYKPAVFIGVFFFLRQMAGTSVILTYAVSVGGAVGVGVDPYLVAVCLGAGRTVAGVAGAALSARWGRRSPVTYAGCIMSFAIICLAHNTPTHSGGLPDGWYSLVAAPGLLVVFVLSSTIASDVPRSMASEIFPTDVRGMSTAAGLCVIYVSSFISLKIYPALLLGLGRRGLFTVYSVLSVASTVWTILLLPETHGKTLQEIEAIYTGDVARVVQPERHPLNIEEDDARPKQNTQLDEEESNVDNTMNAPRDKKCLESTSTDDIQVSGRKNYAC